MCGIYGYVTTQPSKDTLDVFEYLGIASEIRGRHATGYYGVNGSTVTGKLPIPATEFFQTPTYRRVYGEIPNLMIGHNRYATSGNPRILRNNHPFVSRRFGFVHNGNVKNIKDDDLVPTKSECDSEKLFRYFLLKFRATHDHKAALTRAMRMFDSGDYACALVDNQERTLYLFRNNGRPLCYVKAGKQVYFASTKEILRDSLHAAGIRTKKLKMLNLRIGTILKITEDGDVTVWRVEGLRDPDSGDSRMLSPASTFAQISSYGQSNRTVITSTVGGKTVRRIRRKYVVDPEEYGYGGYSPRGYKKSKKEKAREIPRWKCRICGKKFITCEFTSRHIVNEHGIKDVVKVYDNIDIPGR